MTHRKVSTRVLIPWVATLSRVEVRATYAYAYGCAHMPTYRSAATLLSADGTRTSGTAALFTEPTRGTRTPPWAGDFRPATDAPRIKDAVGKTLTLEMPDGRTGKVVVQSLKTGKGGIILALMGEDAAPF
jgi:hypothetical protein